MRFTFSFLVALALAVSFSTRPSKSTSIVTPYACYVKEYVGCYTDWDNGMRALTHSAQDTDEDPMSHELCAWMCDLFNYTMAAVEDKVCFFFPL